MSNNEKRETLEEIAQREAEAERRAADARAMHLANAERIAKEVPERFLQLAKDVREHVARFNAVADPQKRLTWEESTALAARDPNLNADFHLTFGRPGADCTMALTAMSRSTGPDVYLIEISGKLHEDSFLMRLEGAVLRGEKGPEIGWRIFLNLRRVERPLDELADRVVRAVVKADVSLL
jgi:hypothetical protein